ncbi:hypothetical protein [Rhizobium sophorae]|uniref:hypothetical protein n=1 Tax=Rhizobium sophorae TaxID=1535242 RepID=UPI001AEE4266|nr:hypothetical protein [Rhizobium sophorae]
MPVEARITDIDLSALTVARSYHPSPTAWEDEILYFMMLDRFSDGRESDYIANDGTPQAAGPLRRRYSRTLTATTQSLPMPTPLAGATPGLGGAAER